MQVLLAHGPLFITGHWSRNRANVRSWESEREHLLSAGKAVKNVELPLVAKFPSRMCSRRGVSGLRCLAKSLAWRAWVIFFWSLPSGCKRMASRSTAPSGSALKAAWVASWAMVAGWEELRLRGYWIWASTAWATSPQLPKYASGANL